MLIKEIDRLDAEALKRTLDRPPNMLGPAVDAAHFAALRVDVEAELCGDHDAVADRPKRFADYLLIVEGAVDLRSVEEGDAPIDGVADQPHAVALGQSRSVALADAHAA